ncbi:MAG: transglutaminase-like domain-containing protein [Paraprevotella sp.]|nr:transglutaminase-like domain-containing protein [Paraprevotella sp.]
MRKTNLKGAVLCCSLALLSSCSNENDDMRLPDGTAPDNVENVNFTTLDFPQDDGSVSLNGTGAENLLALLKKTEPDRALAIGELNITDAQFQEIKEFTDALVKDCANEAAKYKAIFNWVSTNIKYDFADNDPYPVFINRKAICQGYSNLTKVMLLTQDIPAIIVNGYLYGMGHAWNYAYYNGKWRVCDTTNKGDFDAASVGTYRFLAPTQTDIALFEDDEFTYDFRDSYLNIAQVKQGEAETAIPFSVEGFRIKSLNPHAPLPENITSLYIGKNIETFGVSIIGLNLQGKNLTDIQIDESNPRLCSYEGAVYEKNGANRYLYYIPGKLECLSLLPMNKVEKNTVFDQPGLKTIEFAEGTELIEAYGVEKCPSLERAYVPLNTVIEDKAFYDVAPNFEIIRRNKTGITNVYM